MKEENLKQREESNLNQKEELLHQILFLKKLCVILIASIIGGFFFMRNQFLEIKSYIDNQTSNITSNVHASIAGIGDRFSYLLDEKNSILSRYESNQLNFNPEKKTVDFSFLCVPKQYEDDMTVVFVIHCDEEIKTIPAIKQDVLEFTAEASIPLCEQIIVSVILEKGNIKYTQQLENIDLKSQYLLDIASHFEGNYSNLSHAGKVKLEGVVRVYDNRFLQNNAISSGIEF